MQGLQSRRVLGVLGVCGYVHAEHHADRHVTQAHRFLGLCAILPGCLPTLESVCQEVRGAFERVPDVLCLEAPLSHVAVGERVNHKVTVN